jgi:hypothetical protein
MREIVRSIGSKIEPLDAPAAEHRVEVIDWIDWIDSGSGIFGTAKPATPP